VFTGSVVKKKNKGEISYNSFNEGYKCSQKKTRAARGSVGHHILIVGLQVSFKKKTKR
jgi:hypothetical protein